MAGPFATATEVCEFSGMSIPSDLSRLQALCYKASAVIRAHCNQTLSLVSGDVIAVYPTASSFLSLPERPVTAVTQVLVGGVATTDYYIVPRGLRSGTLSSPGSAWTQGATVTYTHGHAETSEAFKAIQAVCIEMVKRAYTADETGQALAQGGIPVETAGFPTTMFLTLDNKETLRPFMRGPVR
jgi:hypothetical protein